MTRLIALVLALLGRRRGYDFGVFSDAGMISGPYATREAAEAVRAGQSQLMVLPLCPTHRSQAAFACENCSGMEST